MVTRNECGFGGKVWVCLWCMEGVFELEKLCAWCARESTTRGCCGILNQRSNEGERWEERGGAQTALDQKNLNLNLNFELEVEIFCLQNPPV